MTRFSNSPYVCETCGLPLQPAGTGFRHAVNAQTKHRSCGRPAPVKRGERELKPGTVLTVWRPAGSVTVDRRPFRQKFRPTSFDYLVGTATPLRRGGEIVAYATITGVEVAKDGSGVLLTMEILDSSEEAA